MQRTKIVHLLQSDAAQEDVVVMGWLRTKREAKGFAFLELNDGSCLANLQIIADATIPGSEHLEQLGTGASLKVRGNLAESPGKGQRWELQATELSVFGQADPERYPLQKKRHSDEFLRSIAELRPRTNKYGAVNRLRSELALTMHRFFHERGFFYIHSPIITGLDCEGAGELFRVTTQDPQAADSQAARDADFFGKRAFLTVSGQLTAEVMACALGDVYTFGPTFRAENSNTPRHAAEFWMVEPEMAFADLQDAVDLAEDLVRTCVGQVRQARDEDLNLFARFVSTELEARLDLLQEPFERITYHQAIDILAQSGRSFEYPPEQGRDLQTEHERFLSEEYFKKGVVVTNYPASIKPFYMRVDEDGQTVAALDVLLPGVGEIIGGSQREERLEVLTERMQVLGLQPEEYEWYRNLRRFGTVPHAGFGLGFERLLMYMTGVHNIRDVLPFPRTPNNLSF